MIRRVFLAFLLMMVCILISAQGRLVTGMITDNRGVPIVGPTICQMNTSNCTIADSNGAFKLQLSEEGQMNLKIECLGFNTVQVVLDETTTYPLKVTLTPMYFADDAYSEETSNRYNTQFVSVSSLSLNAIFTDFKQFSSSIGKYNTDLMDYFAVTGPEIGICFSRIYTGLGFGFGYNFRHEYDTLYVDLNNTAYYLNFGYSIISSPRIRLTPIVSIRWLRFRLLNYSSDHKITLARYLDERDLDLRFNQMIAVTGMNLEYLMYNNVAGSEDYWSVGFFGGYAIKLNQMPWIYSRGNRLITDDHIGLKHFTFGLSITFYTGAKK